MGIRRNSDIPWDWSILKVIQILLLLSFLFLITWIAEDYYISHICLRGKKKSVDSRYLDMRAKVEELQCGTQKRQFLTKKRFSWKWQNFQKWFLSSGVVFSEKTLESYWLQVEMIGIWLDHAHGPEGWLPKESSSSTTRDWGAKPSSLLMAEIPKANHLRCIKNPVNNGIRLPTSTGEFTGVLNHQQYYALVWLRESLRSALANL